MKPEPCEFTSAELLKMAEDDLAYAVAYGDPDGNLAGTALDKVQQAIAQIQHNNGAATPVPVKNDEWKQRLTPMKEEIALEHITSERVGLVEHVVIERIYASTQEPPRMVHTCYDSLTLEQKVERLEVVAQLYFGWINMDGTPRDPAKAMREDCTRYWPEMKACFEGKPDV